MFATHFQKFLILTQKTGSKTLRFTACKLFCHNDFCAGLFQCIDFPVIGIPVKSSTLDGLDALLSTVQMPAGIPVATVAIDGAQNAAILAAEMLAVADDALAAKLGEERKAS